MAPSGPLTVELGNLADPLDDKSAWVPWVDGQDAVLEPGVQGGFHVLMKMRVSGPMPARFVLNKWARRVDDEKLVLRSMITVEPDGSRTATGAWEMDGTRMFMCPSPIGISVIDRRIRFEVILADDGGVQLGRGAVTLQPRCPTDSADYLAFCQKICTG